VELSFFNTTGTSKRPSTRRGGGFSIYFAGSINCASIQGEIQMAENAVVVQPGPARSVADINNRKRLVAAYGPIEVAAAVLADNRLTLGMIAELRV